MRVIFASETPVLPEKSKFKVGSEEDEYRFERKWWVRISPKLEMEEGDQPSDWATVSKILTKVSWTMRMDVRVRKTNADNLQTANIYVRNFGGRFRLVKSFLKLFGETFGNMEALLLKVKLGESACIPFKDYYFDSDDDDDVDRDDADHTGDQEITESVGFKLLMAEEKDVRITWKESYKIPADIAISACKRILDTGYFADCHLVSNQGEHSHCHRVILKENCANFGKEIERGNTNIEVDLSTCGVGALLRFMYYGDLKDVIGNWKLSVELLKAAHSQGVRNLWTAIVDVLMEMEEEPEMKTAAEGFQILVTSRNLATNRDLARKLVGILAKKSAEDVGDSLILHKYTREFGFFNSYMDLASESLQTFSGPPTKRAKLPDQ